MAKSESLNKLVNQPYKYGFSTKIDTEELPPGLNIDTVELISKKKNEPEYMLKFRERALKKWQQMKQPNWAQINHPEINYQDIVYYSAPKIKP